MSVYVLAFSQVNLLSGMVWGWAQVKGFDPSALQSVARGPVSLPCDAVHVTLFKKGSNARELLCVSGTSDGNACFCQIVQNDEGDATKDECACMDLSCQYVLLYKQAVQLRPARWQYLDPAVITPRLNHLGAALAPTVLYCTILCWKLGCKQLQCIH